MKRRKRQIYFVSKVYPHKALVSSIRPVGQLAGGDNVRVGAWLWTNLPKMIYLTTAEDIYWILDSAKNKKVSARICSCHGRQCNG